MAGQESFRERQENELEVLQSIFGNDVVDLRTKGCGWKPLNIRIALEPLKGSSGELAAHVKAKLHVICPSKYPKLVPKIIIEEVIGLSDTHVEQLNKDLVQLTNDKKGDEVIYELAQLVQNFLHTHNKPPPGSLWEQMVHEHVKRREDQEQKQQKQQLMLSQEQQLIRDKVLQRKEMYHNESKSHMRRSMSESSPTHPHHQHRTTSSSDNSETSSLNRCNSHLYPNECMEHRSSEVLYFPNIGRKIQKGCCLGHSQKGCVALSGIDLSTGQLLYITEWNIKYAQLEAKCAASGCNNRSEARTCNEHTTEEVIKCIDQQVSALAQITHKNLVAYECVISMKKKEGIVVYLVQDFVLGTSVNSITNSLGWCIEGASIVARGVLDALIYLHNNGVSHNNLYDCTVFMDNAGTIRVTDFGIVPYLLDIISVPKNVEQDLPALGSLIESLSPIPHADMRDFIDKCNSTRTLSSSDLLDHPFLQPHGPATAVRPLTRTVEPVSRSMSQPVAPTTITSERSRLATEFQMLTWLGNGAYGDVLKVRNILDNREYAIKRIAITHSRKQIYKKMTREVEVLSRLNHENVVRYYNSWIESAPLAGDSKMPNPNFPSADWSASYGDISGQQAVVRIIQTDQSSSSSDDWLVQGAVDSSSDGIEFRNSDGELVSLSSNDGDDDDTDEKLPNKELTRRSAFKSPRPDAQVMYIQMEFCEKSTLRTAIDEGLYADEDRLWQLFREIAEGLSHIHQQGMIHRDLKPVNIFLDSRGQVKIGDFGLATTSFLALQNQSQQQLQHRELVHNSDVGNSLTGKVGTALYVAPELMGNASKSTYNQKVDLYSLGIILFEMSRPPFPTLMERQQVIMAIRHVNIVLPREMLIDPKQVQKVQVIKWLLNHDPAKRPTAEELLASDMVPPAQVEANELQEMLRHALANPQSKAYKHLVSRCLAQKSDTVLELTYHMDFPPLSPILEQFKTKVIALFRKHGGEEVDTPLLSPLVKQTAHNTAVRLMTHSGSVVTLPHDLRVPFIKQIALAGRNRMRRYSVGQVYREKKVFNFHPRQLHECAFDIITPTPGSLLVDAELISIAFEIAAELSKVNPKIVSFRLNHTSLLQAILLYCNVPPDKYHEVFAGILDFMEDKVSKFQLHSTMTNIMHTSKHTATQLMDLLTSEFPLGGSRGSMTGSMVKNLLKTRGEIASLAKVAMKELEVVAGFAQLMGVTCTISAFAGLPVGFERCKMGGIVWQMVGDISSGRRTKQCILAVGGRYDGMLAEFQAQHMAPVTGNPNVSNRPISGAGFSFAMDKMVSVLSLTHQVDLRSLDVVVCATGSGLREVALILRSLWAAGIRAGIVEESDTDEAQDVARTIKAPHIVILGECGTLCVRSWNQHDEFFEKYLSNRQELPDYIQKILFEYSAGSASGVGGGANDSGNASQIGNQVNSALNISGGGGGNNNIGRNTFPNCAPSLPGYQVTFCTPEKLTSNVRRRVENQLTQTMSASLMLFGKKEFVHILVVELPAIVMRAIASTVDPRDPTFKETRDEVATIIERFPKYKRYIQSILDEIMDILKSKKTKPIVGIYSMLDTSYKIIL